MNVLPEDLKLLTSRLDALEKRVCELEHPSRAFEVPASQCEGTQAASQTLEASGPKQASSIFSLFGRVMLGVAGAYVLRAIAQSTWVPRQAIATVAIAYAVAWLVWASRTKDADCKARALYASTSALILAPMLWELTLRFDVLSPLVTAGVLVGFVVLATALAWRHDRAPVLWVAHGAAALTAVALSIATRDLIPFISALLLMVLICEYSLIRDRAYAVRPLVLAVADAAISVLIYIYSGPQSVRSDYPELGPAVLMLPASILFLISGSSVVFKSARMRRKITVVDTTQSLMAFSLVAFTVVFIEPVNFVMILGLVCLLLSAACYAATFVLFRYSTEQRNVRVFATWSAGLFLMGALWSLPSTWAAVCLGVAALAATVLGVRHECRSLGLHGVIYLGVAGIVSGLPAYVFRALVGSMPERPGWSLMLVSVCCFGSYAVVKEHPGEVWRDQVLHMIPALLAACAFTAIIAQGILQLVARVISPDVFHVAFVRTFTVCSVALVLAFSGARWQRMALTRIAYAALAFMAAKLIFEDLRHGRMEFIAGSFFLFAVTLIAVPHLSRMGNKP